MLKFTHYCFELQRSCYYDLNMLNTTDYGTFFTISKRNDGLVLHDSAL